MYRVSIFQASYDTITKAVIPTRIVTAVVWKANLYINVPQKIYIYNTINFHGTMELQVY